MSLISHDTDRVTRLAVSDLAQLGRIKYWKKREQRSQRRLLRSGRLQRVEEAWNSHRDDTRTVLQLARRSAWSGLSALLLFGASELLAYGLGRIDWGPFKFLDQRLAAGDYQSFVGTAVGAAATFLALFFTTVGVVASTAYQSVPGEIRKLFVEERTSAIYVRGVVRALVLGTALLVAGALSYKPSTLSIVVLAVLAVNAVLRLMVLGGELFNFFDPSTLSRPLLPRFARALRRASAPGTAQDAGNQQIAHEDAAGILRLYQRITVLLSQRPGREAAASLTVARQLVVIAATYGQVKNGIPPESRWWGRTPTHANWLTMDYHRLKVAMATSTGVAPTMAADALWVERQLEESLRGILATLAESERPTAAIQLVGEASPIIAGLASHLLIDEALAFEPVFSDAMAVIVSSGGGTPANSEMSVLDSMAAAERAVLPVIELWVGYVHALQRLTKQDIIAVLDRAIAEPSEMYKAALPRPVIELLEKFARSVSRERTAEGAQITPAWWIHHFAARELIRHLRLCHDKILNRIESHLTGLVKEQSEAGRPQQAAVMIFSSLELISRMQHHRGLVETTFGRLSGLRNLNTGDSSWPELPDSKHLLETMRDSLLRTLAGNTPKLYASSHDPALPDLFGQAARHLFDATFDAILEGQTDLARDLFQVVFTEADATRQRLLTDLRDQADRTQFIYGTEPIVAVMELSGYAMLMQALDGNGIWEDVRGLWDRILAADTNGAVPQWLISILTGLESTYSITGSGMARITRQQRLKQLFSERGITTSDYAGRTVPGQQTPRPHRDAIVSAFASDDMYRPYEMTDLFVAEYLRNHLPAAVKLPHHTTWLVKRLDRDRREDLGDA